MGAVAKCFYLEETAKVIRYLRRYHLDDEHCCRGARVELDVVEVPPKTSSPGWEPKQLVALDDPRWPAACECGRVFTDQDEWQIFTERVYTRSDNGEETTIRDAPVGAMWDAWWYMDWRRGPDGLHLIVKCPEDGHHWHIDGRANNCTKPEDEEHRCWVRTGVPPLITVGKTGGPTCDAGAGSIQTPTWHGFLKEGVFVL